MILRLTGSLRLRSAWLGDRRSKLKTQTHGKQSTLNLYDQGPGAWDSVGLGTRGVLGRPPCYPRHGPKSLAISSLLLRSLTAV